MTLATTEDWLARPGTVGRALPHQEIVVLDDDGARLPPRTEGTIYFRFLDGTRFAYFGDPAKTEAAYGPEGAFTAGDVGWMDDDGYLYISGRRAEVIVSAGVNIYPAEVEAAIDGVEGVADVAVVGGPDDDRGEQVVAFVVAAPGIARDELVGAVETVARERLAAYKRPRQVVVCESVPRDPTGKLLRKRLRDELWGGRTGFAAHGASSSSTGTTCACSRASASGASGSAVGTSSRSSGTTSWCCSRTSSGGGMSVMPRTVPLPRVRDAAGNAAESRVRSRRRAPDHR
jgi:acyl-coenzyme A synthetase/AMP-(fatty) acid ligase